MIELRQLGLGEEVILEKIRGTACEFDVTIDGLRKLKAAGVSSAVISEMIRASRKTGEEKSAAKAEEAGRDDPSAQHEAGIYFYDDTGGTPKMTALEPTVYQQAKSGGMFKSMLTAGLMKSKAKAVLNGAHATFQLPVRRPTFYFYFEVKQSGLSGSGAQTGLPGVWAGYFGAATSANEFALARTELKANSRELVVGEIGAFSSSSGVQDKAIQQFDFEKIAAGVYKVTPRADLDDGEYCFFYGGSAPAATYGMGGGGGGRVFDFGIRSSSPKPMPEPKD
ncbi:MAG: hypothetical protein ABI672_11035 [Vicinamibacteria bacterium]